MFFHNKDFIVLQFVSLLLLTGAGGTGLMKAVALTFFNKDRKVAGLFFYKREGCIGIRRLFNLCL